MSMKNYDIVIVGGGPGGYVAAIKAAQYGAKVAVVEKENVGGICLNHGCIPTKTFLKSAKTYQTLQHASDFGLTISGDLSFDWTKIVSRKDGVVKQLTGGVGFLLKKNGVDVYNGFGEVISSSSVKVGSETLNTKHVIIATGASAIVPPIPGVKEAFEKGTLVTYKELLNVQSVPQNLVVVGGGVIGVEFATVFNSFGSKVTIIEKMDTILPTMDHEIIDAYTKRLKKDGIKVLTQAEVKAVDGKNITYLLDGKETTVSAD